MGLAKCSKLSLRPDRQCIIDAIAGLDGYLRHGESSVETKVNSQFCKLTTWQREVAIRVGYLERLKSISDRININAKFFDGLVQFAKTEYNVSDYELGNSHHREACYSRVVELLEHFVRDWAVETADERQQLIDPILKEIGTHLHKGDQVLVPGSGLCRLAYEISKLGLNTYAVDLSPLMDIGSRFIFASQQHEYSIYPYIHEFSHQVSDQYQLRSVQVPDISPLSQPPNLSIQLGDFQKIPGYAKYDAIATVFLIDTAENVFDYLEHIYRLLKPNGIWINFGPLKWGTAPTIEPTLDELERMIELLDWKFITKFEGSNEYFGDPKSLWASRYRLRGWTAQKKEQE